MSSVGRPPLAAEGLVVAHASGEAFAPPVSFSFSGRCLGLFGPNGSGKSTLLRAFADPRFVARGRAHAAAPVRGLPQAPPGDARLVDEWLGVHPLVAALDRLARGEGSAADLAVVDDRWTFVDELDDAFVSWGLDPNLRHRPSGSLSFGERTRAWLAHGFLDAPSVLLLDEPTELLDRKGRAQLLDELSRTKATVVVASHDRELLERCDGLLALPLDDQRGAVVEPGPFSRVWAEREAARQRAVAERERVAQEAAAVAAKLRATQKKREDRARRGQASRASGSQPKTLHDFEQERAEQGQKRAAREARRAKGDATDALARAREAAPLRAGLTWDLDTAAVGPDVDVVVVNDASIAPGDAEIPVVLREVRLHVRGPERVALTGANGAGKSTLLRWLARVSTAPVGPDAFGREARVGPAVVVEGPARNPAAPVGDGDPRDDPSGGRPEEERASGAGETEAGGSTPVARVRAASGDTLDEGEARTRLARMGVPADAHRRPLSTLSGGEHVRASLVIAAATVRAPDRRTAGAGLHAGPHAGPHAGQADGRAPQLWLFDEPTAGLDLESQEALLDGIARLPVAVVLASHDLAWLARARPTRWWHLDDGRVVERDPRDLERLGRGAR